MTLVQLNIFNEREIIKPQPSKSYENFVKKFERKKTTDDCYTPPAVYEAVKNFVNDYIYELSGCKILRPFKPGGDYLSENYDDNTVVIDNPPFSIYSQIVRNYLQLDVKFFLFAPALTLFVRNSNCKYVITNSNITYANGAKVRTSFATNLLHEDYKLRVSPILSNKIQEAQNPTKPLKPCLLPKNYISSAQLLKYCKGEDFILTGSGDFLTHIGNKKIFGSAMRLTEDDVEILKLKSKEVYNEKNRS